MNVDPKPGDAGRETGAGASTRSMMAAYLGTLLAFCLLDFAWLGLLAPSFYQSQIGGLLLDVPRWPAVVFFYLLYIVGLVALCILPVVRATGDADTDGRMKVALSGALFGLVAYGTYNLSNLATLDGWTVPVTMVDMIWGTVASAIACTSGHLAVRRFGLR